MNNTTNHRATLTNTNNAKALPWYEIQCPIFYDFSKEDKGETNFAFFDNWYNTEKDKIISENNNNNINKKKTIRPNEGVDNKNYRDYKKMFLYENKPRSKRTNISSTSLNLVTCKTMKILNIENNNINKVKPINKTNNTTNNIVNPMYGKFHNLTVNNLIYNNNMTNINLNDEHNKDKENNKELLNNQSIQLPIKPPVPVDNVPKRIHNKK